MPRPSASLTLARTIALGLVVLNAVALDASAQNYPAKPIRLIIASAPGGSGDIVGRAFAQRAALGQPLVVENVPGATGTIGLTRAAKSPPDGYTLTIGATASFAVSPNMNSKLGYDPVRDFAPIAILSQTFSALVVNASVPANTVAELVAFARANPGKINFASLGNGSTHHLLGEMLRNSAGIDIVHVPYKGNAQALLALLANEVQFFFFPVFVDAMSHLSSGRLKALGVSLARRSSLAPDVPTLTESGYDIVAPSWHVLVAPAGTPNPIVQRLAAEVRRINSSDEMKRSLAQQGSEAIDMTPEALKDFIASELARYRRIVRDAGVKTE